jgi:hypothetical protein
MSVFVLCFLSGNDLLEISICLDFDIAVKFLETRKETHQILEYKLTDGITDPVPLFAYSYKDDVLVKHTKFSF